MREGEAGVEVGEAVEEEEGARTGQHPRPIAPMMPRQTRGAYWKLNLKMCGLGMKSMKRWASQELVKALEGMGGW